MSYYGNSKSNIPIAKVVWGKFRRTLYCPYTNCGKEIENHNVSDYGDDEIHPCEHCGKSIRWTPMWDSKDLRD